MNIKEFNFKHKREKLSASYVEFESTEELLYHVSKEDLLRIYNFGAKVLARELLIGKNPLGQKRKTLKIKLETLSSEQLSHLRQLGFLGPKE